MTDQSTSAGGVNRRTLLRGSLAATAIAPVGGALAGCATGGSSGSSGSSSSSEGKSASHSKSNPFGVKKDSKIDAVIFDGGYGTDYVKYAGEQVKDKQDGVTAKVHASNNIKQELQPRFTGGNPPDLIDNSGANKIGISSILKEIDSLDDLLDAQNYEGKKIKDTLYPGATKPGTYNGKFKVLNYALEVFGLWYSKSLFDKHGWEPPKTWDDVLALGKKAKAKDKYLFVWGKEAADYYLTLAVGSAIKEGGDDVRLALDNLKPKAYSKPAVQDVFKALHECVKKGYFKPGGAGTQFTKAQAQWSKSQDSLLYASGSWIENEMKKATAKDFKMTGVPAPALSNSPKMGMKALHSKPDEHYVVPSKGENSAGGKELLRAMLSKDAAQNFSKKILASTVVKGLIPDDGFGSTALVSQKKMLDEAGDNVFDWNYPDLYGMGSDHITIWNSFLSGKLDVAELTKKLQHVSDKVRKDPDVKVRKVT
jgi:N-acetylglucosamine transport system substrate-binding protein